LKPSNVMLTASGAKLLDFGLAKAMAPLVEDLSANGTTLARAGVTAVGTVVGTVQYMAPEQVEGRATDARTDIFALGQVVFEMATGHCAFEGRSAATIAAAILTVDPPPVSSLQPTAPPALDRLVRVCLEKSSDKRWQSAHDIGVLLRTMASAAEENAGAALRRKEPSAVRWIPWGVAAAAAAAALFLALRPSIATAPAATAVTFSVPPPPDLRFLSSAEGSEIAVSPDGTKLAFVTANGGVWVRPLDALTATAIAGTENAIGAFWSPDGRSIGFFAAGMLNRIDASGGPVVPLCSVAKSTGHTGTWGKDSIVFAGITGQTIFRVPTGGGPPVALLKPDAAQHETRLLWPHFLPDGRRFLYVAWHDDRTGRLLLWQPDGPPREIMTVISNVEYVEPGYLLFVRDGTLLALRFDASRVAISGDPVAIAQPVNYVLMPGTAHFSTSRNGVLAYQAHADLSHIAWFDAAGRELEALAPSARHLSVRVSPDGRQVAFGRASAGPGTLDLWLFDVERRTETRLTSDIGNELEALWTPDQSGLVYGAGPFGAPQVVIRDLSTGVERRIQPGDGLQGAEDFTPGGTSLVYLERRNATGNYQVLTVPLQGGRPEPILDPQYNYDAARFSPDGTWLAYASDESGTMDVYAARWPGLRERLRISTGGGDHPRWARDGRQLFYLSSAGVMNVSMASGQPGRAQVLSDRAHSGAWSDFDVAPDGRFVAIVRESVGAQQPLTVVVNWRSRLP
jgi:Tol biopolymer transport system component